MKNLCEVMLVPSGAHLLASAEKADRRRLQQAKRQTLAASKVARHARLVARTRAAAATSTDGAAGEFEVTDEQQYDIQTNLIITQLAMFYSLQRFNHHRRPSSGTEWSLLA